MKRLFLVMLLSLFTVGNSQPLPTFSGRTKLLAIGMSATLVGSLGTRLYHFFRRKNPHEPKSTALKRVQVVFDRLALLLGGGASVSAYFDHRSSMKQPGADPAPSSVVRTTPQPGPSVPSPGPSVPSPGPSVPSPGPSVPSPGPSVPSPRPTLSTKQLYPDALHVPELVVHSDVSPESGPIAQFFTENEKQWSFTVPQNRVVSNPYAWNLLTFYLHHVAPRGLVDIGDQEDALQWVIRQGAFDDEDEVKRLTSKFGRQVSFHDVMEAVKKKEIEVSDLRISYRFMAYIARHINVPFIGLDRLFVQKDGNVFYSVDAAGLGTKIAFGLEDAGMQARLKQHFGYSSHFPLAMGFSGGNFSLILPPNLSMKPQAFFKTRYDKLAKKWNWCPKGFEKDLHYDGGGEEEIYNFFKIETSHFSLRRAKHFYVDPARIVNPPGDGSCGWHVLTLYLSSLADGVSHQKIMLNGSVYRWVKDYVLDKKRGDPAFEALLKEVGNHDVKDFTDTHAGVSSDKWMGSVLLSKVAVRHGIPFIMLEPVEGKKDYYEIVELSIGKQARTPSALDGRVDPNRTRGVNKKEPFVVLRVGRAHWQLVLPPDLRRV